MLTATDRVLASCPLRTAPWPTPDGVCAWCGVVLPKRRSRWCSDECVNALGRNHGWNAARAAAIRRDGSRCVRCGADEWFAEGRAWYAFLLWVTRRGEPNRAYRFLREELRQRRLEVNHKTPILGRHGEFGCHHHLDGLETLCHRCHVAETARQFGHRTAVTLDLFEGTG